MKLNDTKSRPKASNYGKFQTKGIKVVGKWKEVKIDPNMFADGQMDDLVCFEELTDYQLVSPAKNPSSLFSKEAPKRKAQAVSEEEEEGESSSPKKKIKLKKSKNVATEGTSTQKEVEVKDSELEAQGDGMVCDDPEAGEKTSENLVQTAPKKKKNKGRKGLEPSQSTAVKVPKKLSLSTPAVFSWQQMWQLGVWIFLKSSMSSITRSHVPRRFMSTEVVELLELPMKVSA
uniref:DEAD-box helicase 24 n=1 Tax=Cercocebus atys TaxID=9531 RepID=A0A2K5MY32_CERAT